MKKVLFWVGLAVLAYFVYKSFEYFRVGPGADSPCPSMCRNAGSMHPICVEGRKQGRPNCGSGGFT